MKKNVFILGICCLMLSIHSCSKEEEDCPSPVPMDSLIISFDATGNGLPVEYQKPFSDPLNRLMRISFLQHYVSNVYLLNGDKSTLINDVSLLTYIDNPTDPSGEKQKIRLSVPRST